ncbi:MAG: PepSY domain-containing protein [Pontixanthobacter sp.]
MARTAWWRNLARWHIWLGWLIGVPLVMWTVTGLVMVSRPIDEVRGDHLRRDLPQSALLPGNPVPIDFQPGSSTRYSEMRVIRQGDRAVWLLTTTDGEIERYRADSVGDPLPDIDETFARAMVAERIVGGDRVRKIESFSAADAPIDLRRPIPTWRLTLQDGARIYVHRQTGEIAAVRTRFWRVFDVMWGLHIMDLQTREDTSHPVLIAFAALAAIGSLFGCVLLFRRRKPKPGRADAG